MYLSVAANYSADSFQQNERKAFDKQLTVNCMFLTDLKHCFSINTVKKLQCHERDLVTDTEGIRKMLKPEPAALFLFLKTDILLYPD